MTFSPDENGWLPPAITPEGLVLIPGLVPEDQIDGTLPERFPIRTVLFLVGAAVLAFVIAKGRR